MSYKDNEMLALRKVTLYGEVTNSNIGETINQLVYLDHLNSDPIELIINSIGGSPSAAFALIDIIDSLKSKVNTVGLGDICSAGLMIFMAGNNRITTKNTCILSHRYAWGRAMIKHAELLARRKEEDLTHLRIINHYKKVTGLSKEKLEEYLLKESDTFLTAEEALKYNIATKIL